MKKKIKIHRDGSISISYGSIEKAGICFNDGKEPCGTWCPLFPMIYKNPDGYSLGFVCHGGFIEIIDAEYEGDEE